MAKVALLIGISEYEPGLNPLPSATQDIEAIQRVLQHPEMGGFAEADVTLLKNPDRQKMEESIEHLFSGRQKDDLVLLFFSGHGITDDTGKLFLASCQTRKNQKGELIRATAVAASFIHDSMDRTRSKRKVVVLDCCHSGAFAEGLSAKDDGFVDIKSQLGGEGRVVLASSTSTQYSFEQQGSGLSVYTRALVEGIETGEADLDNDGVISVNELHEYAAGKVQEALPAMKPEIYVSKEGYRIRLAQAFIGDPKLRYRREVKKHTVHGEISSITRGTLDALRNNLNLSSGEALAIELEELSPIHERKQNLRRYEQEFRGAIQREFPVSKKTRDELKYFQQALKLENRDIDQIEAQIIAQKETTQFPANVILEQTTTNQRQNNTSKLLTLIQPLIPFGSLAAAPRINHSSKVFKVTAALVALTGIMALTYWRSDQSRQFLLQQAEILTNGGGLSSAIAPWFDNRAKDNARLQEVHRVLDVADDLQGAREIEEKIISGDLKQQAQVLISQKDEAIGSAYFLKIQEVLQVDDTPGARKIKEKITHAEWKQKAEDLIAQKEEAIRVFKDQQIQAAKQAQRAASEQAQRATEAALDEAKRAAEAADQAKRAAEAANQPQAESKSQSILELVLGTGSKDYSFCFEVTGTDVGIRSDGDRSNQVMGDVILRVGVGEVVYATEESREAQSPEELEMYHWLQITHPVKGWIAANWLQQTACP